MALYLESGYINQKWIEEQADKNNISFIIEIGGRQVGKTYGTLKLMLDSNKTFILMRRTITEMEFICNDINNPFTVFQNYDIRIKKDSKYTGVIYKFENEEKFIGSVMSLSSIAKIRGFNGSLYTDIVFDEFIPENHVIKIKDEGDAFSNAIITISGNRELEDKKPLRVWLLANSNNIYSRILETLNIQRKIEEMKKENKEISILKNRGIMIVLPKSEKIMKKRKQTALAKAINQNSNFSKMAYDNEFAYNDDSNIMNVNLREYIPLFTIIGKFTVNKHKSNGKYYISNYALGTCAEYGDTDREKALLNRKYVNLRSKYLKGNMYFQSLILKENFIDVFFS